MVEPSDNFLESKSKGALEPQKTTKTEQKTKDEVLDFPPRGGSRLSRREMEEIRAEVDAEFAAELRRPKIKNKEAVKKCCGR